MVKVGTIITLGGFVCQNFGTRELHPSAGIAQLVLTLLMTLLRAGLRSKVGVPPTNIQELQQGFVACDLATKLTGYECCLPVTGFDGDKKSKDRSAMKHWNMNVEVRRLLEKHRQESQQGYQRVFSSPLKIHAKIAYHEADALQIAQVAESCYKAMK